MVRSTGPLIYVNLPARCGARVFRQCGEVRAWLGWALAGALAIVFAGCSGSGLGGGARPFAVRMVDAENGWPVPMVALRTHGQAFFVSDNNGLVALDAPEFEGRAVWFEVQGSGYGVPVDAFGTHGITLSPVRGGTAVVRLNRTLPAKRLGRLTGSGLFAESQKLGLEKPWRESGVAGCDSVQLARQGNSLRWVWGDTHLFENPIGIFHATGAVTDLKSAMCLKPPARPTFQYFRDGSGQVRGLARMPGEGPTWLGGMTSVPDRHGREKLVAAYMKARGELEIHQIGLLVWNEKMETFDHLRTLWRSGKPGDKPPLYPDGHPVHWKAPDGSDRLLFGDPFPRLEMPATFEAWSDPSQWKALEPQQSVPSKEGREKVVPHRGSIAWSSHLKKWVSVFTQLGGKPSHLGEVWFATADTPAGPWRGAVKIASHSGRTFYNPRIHAELAGMPPDVILFEGTLSTSFAENAVPLPRHDYNQILYRLDLDEL